jgi:hypothetical protein
MHGRTRGRPSYENKVLKNLQRVLCFQGYYLVKIPAGVSIRSSVTEDLINVQMCYYCQDCSIKVVKVLPVQGNQRPQAPDATAGKTSEMMSHIGGEVLVQREKLTKPGTNSAYEPLDLEIGMVLATHGYRIHIVDCDTTTQDYYKNEHGKALGGARPYPHDQAQELEDGLHKKMLQVGLKHPHTCTPS